jgi:hypothetical protein
MSFEWQRGDDYTISDDRTHVDDDRVTEMIGGTYWAKGMPRDLMARALDDSLVFGIYHAAEGQVGIARVITDRATFAYLTDVFIAPEHRRVGPGEMAGQGDRRTSGPAEGSPLDTADRGCPHAIRDNRFSAGRGR